MEGLRAASLVLELAWVVAPAEGNRLALRLEQASGGLVPTRVEAREAADARVRELEQLLESQGKQPS